MGLKRLRNDEIVNARWIRTYWKDKLKSRETAK